MRAWEVTGPAPIDEHPLRLVERDVPQPAPGQVRVRVTTCGVCRTDLHVAEGDLPVHRPHVVPGHEVVGRVRGPGARCRTVRSRATGSAWPGWRPPAGPAGSAGGATRTSASGPPSPVGTTTVGTPRRRSSTSATPTACPTSCPTTRRRRSCAPGSSATGRSGCTGIPHGGQLGIYGFGGSAHITAQVARAEGAELYVATRSAEARDLAVELGATWVGEADEQPPVPIDGAILFAPVGDLVLPALAALDRGGVLVIAGIHLTDIPALDYETHLFQERSIRSVTANTRRDGEELLRLAPRLGVRATTAAYPLDRADEALADLAHDRVNGAAVLDVG